MLSAYLLPRTLRPILCVRDVCNVCGNKKSRPYSERFVFYVKHYEVLSSRLIPSRSCSPSIWI